MIEADRNPVRYPRPRLAGIALERAARRLFPVGEPGARVPFILDSRARMNFLNLLPWWGSPSARHAGGRGFEPAVGAIFQAAAPIVPPPSIQTTYGGFRTFAHGTTMKPSLFTIFLIVMIAAVLIAYLGGLFWAERL